MLLKYDSQEKSVWVEIYCGMKCLTTHQKELFNPSWIINLSINNGLIDYATYKARQEINELRNCIAHNNTFAEFTEI